MRFMLLESPFAGTIDESEHKQAVAMNTYETSATVEDQGQVRVVGVPFPPGTPVEVVISPKPRSDNASADANGDALTAARARMRELFATVKGFRMAPKMRREELYDRGRVH